jgi:adenylate cyclase
MKPSQKFFKQHLLPALIFFGCAFALSRLDWFQQFENKTLDMRTQLRAKFKPTPKEDRLAVLGIDEVSLHEFGRWPWERTRHGDLLLLAGAAKTSVVSWDILFTEPSKELTDEKQPVDEYFAGRAQAGQEDGMKVVFGAVRAREDEGGITPDNPVAKASRVRPIAKVEGDQSLITSQPTMLLPAGKLSQSAEVGFVDTPPGTDGFRRWLPQVVRIGGNVYPTLSLQTLIQFLHATPEEVTVQLGKFITIQTKDTVRKIPIDARGAFLVNYRHDLPGFNIYGYSSLYGGLAAKYADGKDVKLPPIDGRILLVGETADGLADFGPSPLNPLTALVLVHANAIENVLREDYAKVAPPVPVWLGAFALGAAGLGFFAKRKLRDHAIYSLGLPAVYAGAAYFSWTQWSLWLPLVGPVLGFVSLQVFEVGRRVLAEQKAKQEIKGMFGTYVSPALVSKIIDSGKPPELGGHDDEITAYFSDIQAFSTFSEKLKSGPLVELMNEYLTACTDIVQEQGGAVDKYIGDAVVAMFGAPVPLPDHAYRACVTTQLVHRKLAELRVKWKAEGDKWPQIVWNMQTRIGLNSGVCMIGNMGSRSRFNYTMMGDNVNLAARMESGAKSWGAYTMVAEATKLACEKHGGDRVVFRLLGRIVVKGRSTAVPIYEIVGLKEHVTSQTRECLSIFEQGLAKHFARDWDGAIALFRQSSLIEPNIPGQTPGVVSNPSLVYIGITEHYKEEPPPENWDGVYHMKEK